MLSYAIPSFTPMIEKNRIVATNNSLIAALSLARQSSIAHSKDAYVCELKNDQECNIDRPFNADWSNGWMVFVDTNANKKFDPEDDIKLVEKRDSNSNVAVVFNQRGRLRFRADGTSRSAGFYVCSEEQAKHILLLYTGRTRISENLTDKQQKTCTKKLKKNA